MNVELISPYGFCFGVKNAINIAKKAKEENEGKEVFVLGSLVHNEQISNELKTFGLTILDEKKQSMAEMLEKLPKESVVVFPAHGHSPSIDELAKEKKMIVYDATCAFVKSNEKMILEALEDGNEVLYIGEEGHAEANGVLGLDRNKIHLITTKNLKMPEKMHTEEFVVVSQTTMSPDDIDMCLKTIKDNLKHFKLLEGRCHETKNRQAAIKNANDDIDCYLLMGSLSSNNTNKLAQLISKYHPNSFIIRALTIDDIKRKEMVFKKYKHIGIVSGASTPNDVVEYAFNFIKCLN